jgi:hypothetical protein
MVKDAMEYREKNNVTRTDFIQLLMELKKKGQVESDEKVTKVEDDAQYDAESSKLGKYFISKFRLYFNCPPNLPFFN